MMSSVPLRRTVGAAALLSCVGLLSSCGDGVPSVTARSAGSATSAQAPSRADRFAPAPFEVLHVSYPFVAAGSPTDLRATLLCVDLVGSGVIPSPEDRPDKCRIDASLTGAIDGTAFSTRGEPSEDGLSFQFHVPALEASQSLTYQLLFTSQAGDVEAYPSTAQKLTTTAVDVASGAQGVSVDLAAANEVQPTDLVSIPYGPGDASLGAHIGGEEAPSTPSSFRPTADGVLVADWLNQRIVDVSSGTPKTVAKLPVRRPVDIAAGQDGRLYASTLGMGASVYAQDSGGQWRAERLRTGIGTEIAVDGARVQSWVGPGLWRTTVDHGRPLPAAEQAQAAVTGTPAKTAAGRPIEVGVVGATALHISAPGTNETLHLSKGQRWGDVYFARPTADGVVVAVLVYDGTTDATVLVTTHRGKEAVLRALPAPSADLEVQSGAVRWDPRRDRPVIALPSPTAFVLGWF